MKRLFEITNGAIGESYVRVYAWADSEDRALELAHEQFLLAGKSFVNLHAVRLFAEGMDEFCTAPSDCGWHLG